MKLEIRDFKAKSGRDSGLTVCEAGGMQREPSGLRDCPKFWVGITGLKNPIVDPLFAQGRESNLVSRPQLFKSWISNRSNKSFSMATG